MDKKKILILASEFDKSVPPVIQKIKEQDVNVLTIFTEQFPTKLLLNISLNNDRNFEASFFSKETNELIPLKNFHSVWYRHAGKPIPHEEITDERARAFIKEECNYALEGLWKILEKDSFWISKPTNMRFCSYRINQLHVALTLGFKIPKTIISNDPKEISNFFYNNNKNIISKAVGVGVPILNKEGYTYFEVIFTHKITEQEIFDYIETTNYSPHIYQECIDKDIELRVTVVGNKTFTCAIHSQDHSDDEVKLDWRRVIPTEINHKIIDIPTELSNLCIKLVHEFGLKYGAIDILKDKKGNYIFLEINCDGQYGWIEHLTGAEITEELVNLIVNHN